jgi:hypothetical protein
MNLNDFHARVRRVTGLGSDATDLALITGWINEGVVQFLRETKMNTRLATLAVTAGQEDYTLDDDILAMQGLWYSPADTTQRRLLQPVSVETMFELRLPDQSANSLTRHYCLSGAHTLMLHAAPASSDDELHIMYVPRPAALSSTADAPSATANGNIPAEYHPVIEAYAKWTGAEAEEHKGSDNGLQFQAQYEREIAKIKGEMKRKAGAVQPAVRLGRPRGPHVGNGVDIGL